MYRSIPIMLIAIMLSGCSGTNKFHDPKSGFTVIDYGAHRRGAYLLKTEEGKNIIVSEPSPDVANEITTSLGLSADTFAKLEKAELKADYANKVVDLANRGQALQVLRECLFRLSEMGVSSDISAEQRVTLYKMVLDTVKVMEATRLANSDAPEEVKMTLKDFLKDVSIGTVTPPNED